MFYLQAAITLVCVFYMFRSTLETKFLLFLVSFLCMDLFTLNFGPYTTLKVLLIVSFCISERYTLLQSVQDFKFSKIYVPVILMIIPVIILTINSPHYSTPIGFVKIFTNEIILKYMMLWIGYTVVSNDHNWGKIYNVLYICLIIITMFAILNIVLRSTPWITIGGYQNYDEVEYSTRDRFVVKSLFLSSFVYGFMCIMSLALAFYGYVNNYLPKNKWLTILAMSIMGILVCGSRTVWSCSMIFAFFAIMSFRGNMAVRFLIMFYLSLFFAYLFIPSVTERIDLFVDTFNQNNDITGSSLDMRDMQYNAVLGYIKDNLLFGRGYNYFYFDLGWGQFYSGGRVDVDLRGLEGVHFNYLLERGYFGYISFLLFYLYLVVIIIKTNIASFSKYMALACIFVYLAFAHMTGDLGTQPIALFFIGLFIKLNSVETTNSLIYEE